MSSALACEAAAQVGRSFLWTPAAFGAGAAAYLGLKSEPSAWPLAAAAMIAVIGAVWLCRHAPSRAAGALAGLRAAAVCSLVAGKLRSDWAAAPIAPVRTGRLAPDETLRLVRLIVPSEAVLGPGSAIRIRAPSWIRRRGRLRPAATTSPPGRSRSSTSTASRSTACSPTSQPTSWPGR